MRKIFNFHVDCCGGNSNQMTKLIYIIGTARSGSTILEMLLASSPNVFGAGEVTYFPRHGVLENRACGCKKNVSNCAVWSHVIKDLRVDSTRWAEISAANSRYDRHLGLLRRRPNRSEPWADNLRLLDSISTITGRRCIVDSSKYAARAINIDHLKPEDVTYICLIRSPAGLFESFRKKNKSEQRPKSLLSASIYMIYVSLSLWYAKLRLKEKCTVVRYEDLIRDPEMVLREIETLSGVNLSVPLRNVREEREFSVGHVVTGNRIRHLGKVKFVRSDFHGQEHGFKFRALCGLIDSLQFLLGLKKS